jgi:hypothetical protein
VISQDSEGIEEVEVRAVLVVDAIEEGIEVRVDAQVGVWSSFLLFVLNVRRSVKYLFALQGTSRCTAAIVLTNRIKYQDATPMVVMDQDATSAQEGMTVMITLMLQRLAKM